MKFVSRNIIQKEMSNSMRMLVTKPLSQELINIVKK